ncbi:MAG: chromate efflux transporter [Blastocatellia bacterium]|nr:chromate efflux transporter [Blastocatellia bacterium]
MTTPSETLKTEPSAPCRTVTFSEALRFWVKLGFISFGGPAGQIAIMHRELVERRRWLSEERFLHALNYCMLLPGPEAQQLATYIGWLLHRNWGGLVAGGLFVLPSIFFLLVLSYGYAAYGNLPAVAGLLMGFKPVVVAIVLEAVFKIGGRALKHRVHFGVAALSFGAIFFLHVPFPLIVLAAGLIGLIGNRLVPHVFTAAAPKRKAASPTAKVRHQPTVIDDLAPPSPHTLPSGRKAILVCLVFAGLWVLPLLGLMVWRKQQPLHLDEYLFFTQAALVTFGGAYSVLAYVTQAAVGSYGWLSQSQAVDGLALAETTPGPLIMVLQFVGFMAGWNHPQGLSPVTSAVIGGLVTTYATFLPCFFFIFLGAPYIESLRGNPQLSAALSSITAAVVGVVLNLALVFGIAVMWPFGFGAAPQWWAMAGTFMAFIALYRFKIDVLWVVLGAGAMGLTATML